MPVGRLLISTLTMDLMWHDGVKSTFSFRFPLVALSYQIVIYKEKARACLKIFLCAVMVSSSIPSQTGRIIGLGIDVIGRYFFVRL